jgi:sugar lactone lactonase YvrE
LRNVESLAEDLGERFVGSLDGMSVDTEGHRWVGVAEAVRYRSDVLA